MDPPDEKTRLLGGGHGRGGVVARRSVGSAALEGVEQHVPHGSDVRLDPVEAVAIDISAPDSGASSQAGSPVCVKPLIKTSFSAELAIMPASVPVPSSIIATGAMRDRPETIN